MVSEKPIHPPRPRRRGLVLGCGGTLGAAWTIAALHELEAVLGWDVRDAEVLQGTSAGAELGALFTTGASVDEVLRAALGTGDADPALAKHFASPPSGTPPLPRGPWGGAARARALVGRGAPWLQAAASLLPEGSGDAGFLDALVDGRVAPGAWATHRGARFVAVDVETGARTAFGAPGAPRASLRDAVRASWAIPGWFPSVPIGGRRFVDGGVASPASCDLLADDGLDEVIVLAPMASSDPGPRRGLGRIEGVVRRAMTATLDREVALLRGRGVRVLRLEPTAEDLGVMGPHFLDGSRRLAVLESSLRTARRTVRAALDRDAFGSAPDATAPSKGISAWA